MKRRSGSKMSDRGEIVGEVLGEGEEEWRREHRQGGERG